MGTHFLSEVIDVKDIITLPYNKICIIAGVGSGKNYFVEHDLKEYGNILYISSRRAKIDEILTDETINRFVDYEHEEDFQIVSTTNYGIELTLKSKVNCSDRGLSDLMRLFDFLVIDEAHSIYTDSTFTNASFSVENLMKHWEKVNPNKKIILMTGTPEPIKDYLEKWNYHIINKMGECINVMPKRIVEIKKDEAVKIMQSLDEKEKTIYYGNSATRLISGDNSLINKICETGEIKKEEISVCMGKSSVEKLKSIDSKLEENVNHLKEHLKKENDLPEDTKILLTTSTLKEGINLYSSNIKIAFCESHLLSDIQQFAGRIRNGLDTLYIITNATQHNITDDQMRKNSLEYIYNGGKKGILKDTNIFLNETLKNSDSAFYIAVKYNKNEIENMEIMDIFYSDDLSLQSYGGEVIRDYISLVEKNQYIRFNHIKNEFELYDIRYREQKRVNNELKDDVWRKRIKDYSEKYNIQCFLDEAKKKSDEALSDSKRKTLCNYLSQRKNSIIIDDERNECLEFIKNTLGLKRNCKYKTINKELKRNNCNYTISSCQTSRNRKPLRGIKITESN